jgi:hypothetical protein
MRAQRTSHGPRAARSILARASRPTLSAPAIARLLSKALNLRVIHFPALVIVSLGGGPRRSSIIPQLLRSERAQQRRLPAGARATP